ncbi:MAG: integration host factor subunit beta [Bacteroidota bacterium]|nr:integration host factor subunit beta [Bacteroidota bacterium]MDE2646499.1 integration host factor subunit beta [Bacteroidota bacterium]MXW14289.1 integration host factor subunit beta [Rhodothermaceae bacterium]MYC04940.1 integration host factor subunit beta [Rhodothermaceae bacterium]MYI16647.1 integration host factor subunit beta [Rhodothermaceae bacterium]
MTKSDLVTKVSQEIGPKITKMECNSVVDILLSSITEALEQGNSIEIRGFGTFKVHERKARMGRNPNTGEPVAVPARRVPVFTPSRIFRNRVDQADSTGS